MDIFCQHFQEILLQSQISYFLIFSFELFPSLLLFLQQTQGNHIAVLVLNIRSSVSYLENQTDDILGHCHQCTNHLMDLFSEVIPKYSLADSIYFLLNTEVLFH